MKITKLKKVLIEIFKKNKLNIKHANISANAIIRWMFEYINRFINSAKFFIKL